MKITKVELNNFKSYGDPPTDVKLQKGVNAILGENGSGKSTICEAVGYTLFDYSPSSLTQDDLVRDGESKGKVRVSFISKKDGKEYTVERHVGRSKYDVYKEEDSARLKLSNKSDIIDWIKEHLGISESMDLAAFWQSSVGVPQGKFTNDFAQPPSKRVDIFDPLLEVDVYKNLYKNMRSATKIFDDNIQEIKQNIIRLESKVEDLPKLKEEKKKLEEKIKKSKIKKTKAEREVEKLKQKKSEFEELRENIDEIKDKISLKKGELESLEKSHSEAKENLKEAQKAKKIAQNNKKKYEEYEDKKENLNQLKELKKEKYRLIDEINLLKNKIVRLEQRRENLKEKKEIANQSKSLMEELNSKVDIQEEIEKKIEEIEKNEEKLEKKKEDLSNLQDEIKGKKEEIKYKEREIERIKELQETAELLPDLKNKKENLTSKKSVIQDRIDAEKKAINSLEGAEKPLCPTCNQELDDDRKEEIIDEKSTIIGNLRNELEKIEIDLNKIRSKIEKANQARKQVQRIEDLKVRLREVKSETKELGECEEEIKKDLKNLKKLVQDKEDLKNRLKELNNPKEKYKKAKLRYEDNKDAKNKLKNVIKSLNDRKREKERMEEEKEDYDDIEKELDKIESELKKLEGPYKRYLKNVDLANSLGKKQEKVKDVKSSLEDLKVEIKRLESELEKHEKNFSQEELDTALRLLEKNKEIRTRHQTKIKEKKVQLDDKNEIIRNLKKKKKKLEEKKEKKEELEKDLEFTQFIRQIYKESRPLITEILVAEISKEADYIYRDLRGNPAEQLSWTKDYEIIVEEAGEKRNFLKLSGGEQMCAALSVRLAILKILSNINIVFLDEPTANLDDDKKSNLVNQLKSLTNFSQLFIISHDETFESMTEHIINLEKVGGETKVVSR